MLALIVGLAAFAGSGAAASKAAPVNTVPPTMTGVAKEGQVVRGTSKGQWSGKVTDYNYYWVRCDRNGNSCANITGATSASYRLTSADVGNTVRFRVQAKNTDGSSSAYSVPSAVVASSAVAPPPPAPSTGCPAGAGPAQVANVTPPARLLLDQQQSDPATIIRGINQVILRYHVSDTCNQSVQGALVYVTAVPFQQFDIPAEVATGADGWAEVILHPMAGFPVSPRQQVLALFVRARKQGDDLLAGISARRLFSIPVNAR